ncbi:flagellar hook-basal body protein [Alkalihalobacillus pseudalcaliphilus]|uniref:flagellar hook-basal body protein n=1 Tax=Alkalihalobacillus pseudalcaliphilus TaxID=79884 RepID=UPI00064DDC77|nr:flagellar hook-basal body protein [Alkalihalobacillus pseudalcaliphilus]KMK78289.1 flagellar basal body rod protein FlgG [Alkalihalobacillus pseudalcaliphilus]
MNRAMITASVTMNQIQSQIDSISHNMANSQTVGYKRRESAFHDLLSQQLHSQSNPQMEVGRLTPLGLQVGSGAKIAQTVLQFEQGSLQTTGRELDFALTTANHFFRIESSDGAGTEERLTRAGNFYITANSENPEQLTLVTANGDYLLDNNGERMIIPEDFTSFQLQDGQLFVTMQDGSLENIGTLGIRQVHNPQALVPAGENQFALADLEALGYAEADIVEDVGVAEIAVLQKTLESSNVDMAKEMSDLLVAQRHYQFNSRAISMADQMSGLVNGIRG